jgi:hypothetical protein
VKAFLLIERHSVRFYEKGPEIKGVICVVRAESAEEAARIVGGKYVFVSFMDELRPAVRLPRELFFPYLEKILQYQNGPIHLFIGKEDAGTYLFIIEVPLLQPSEVKV